jgi:hypothetical protein
LEFVSSAADRSGFTEATSNASVAAVCGHAGIAMHNNAAASHACPSHFLPQLRNTISPSTPHSCT